jgi:ADP-glucose pyrophosphorylase
MQRLYGFSGVRPVENMIENFWRAKNYVNSITASSQQDKKTDQVEWTLIIPQKSELQKFAWLDTGYYFIQALKLLQNGLLQDFSSQKHELITKKIIPDFEEKKQDISVNTFSFQQFLAWVEQWLLQNFTSAWVILKSV